MNVRRAGFVVAFLVALAGAFVLDLLGAQETVVGLVAIGAAIMLGEAFELRPPAHVVLPMSYAVFLVLGRAGSYAEAIVVLVGAEVMAALLRRGTLRVRVELLVWRVAVGAGTLSAYRLVAHRIGGTTAIELLLCVACACVAMLAIHELGSQLLYGRGSASLRDRWADLALVTSGALMALGFGGVDGTGEMGAWALALFAIPLFAAWYSFERLASARETYWQTIRALSLAPELGGAVHTGHSERVAGLALEVGANLDLTFDELETLEAAAYLHHIGDLCVEGVPDDGSYSGPDPFDSVELSVKILRDTGHLGAVADVVNAVPITYRTPGSARPTAGGLPGAILKASSAYDELAVTEAHGSNRALALLYSSPAYVYDPRVLSELEHVLHRRGEAVPDD